MHPLHQQYALSMMFLQSDTADKRSLMELEVEAAAILYYPGSSRLENRMK